MVLQKFLDQDYNALVKLHAGKKVEGTLFIDDQFKSNNDSIGPNLSQKYKVVWKRPHEIKPDAKLLVDGATPGDVVQGHIGNCWLVTACCLLAGHPSYLNEVIPDIETQDKQFIDEKKYAGIMRFRFWRMGKQFEVVIDDTLPVNQDTGELIFARSKAGNEFWSSLLEKAYAKLVGSYEHLDSGSSADALVDFTNGVVDDITLSEESDVKRLFEQLSHAQKDGALLACSIGATDSHGDKEKKNDNGLIEGHAYAITSINRVKHAGFFNFDHFEMIRLRNPWGEGEWKGAWSDGSEEWKKVSDSEKKALKLVIDDDGEFWMSFQDFVKNFTKIILCRVVNTSYLSTKPTWRVWDFDSSWTKANAGGCINNKETFLKNPQYLVRVSHKAKLIVSLMQEDHRADKDRKEGTSTNLTIGFVVMKVEDNCQYRAREVGDVVLQPTYINSRQLSARADLHPGSYVVIPTTFEPELTERFFLRLFVDTYYGTCEQLTMTKPKVGSFESDYKYRITVNVSSAANLIKQDFLGKGADPYLVVRYSDVSAGCCVSSRQEQKAVGLTIVKDSLNPEFNSSFVFFGRTIDKALVNIQIWNSNILRPDSFMGEANAAQSDAMEEGKLGKFVEFDTELVSRPLTFFHRSVDHVSGNLAYEVRVETL